MEVREPSAKYLAKPAYKETEAGLIPEDWVCLSIQEVAANCPNALVGGPFGSDLVSKDYVATGVPVVRGQNMALRHISGDFVFVSESKAKDLQANTARPNDIIFTQRGTLGQVSIVPDRPFEKYIVSQSQMKVTLNAGVADAEYVYQYFLSAKGRKQILDSAIQTGVPHTNLGILRSYKIPAPSTVAEQQAIADALGDADALIQSQEQLLAKKRQIKQGAMQELLTGQKRLPGFAEKWEETTLGAIAERIVGGGTPSRNIPLYWNGGIPWMTVKDFANFSPFGTLEYITKEGLEGSASNLVPGGTLITSTRMALGKAVIFEVDVCINQDLKAIHFRKDIDPDFLYFWFQFNGARIAGLGSGSTVMGISLSELRRLHVFKPQHTEQTAIATVLSDMDAEIAALEAKLAKARNLKQGMMQELLTGRIRLLQPTAEVIPFPVPQAETSRVNTKSHNWQINEAVVISVLAKHFGSEQWPLGRKRYTKLSYLFHRHAERQAEGYLKKAAGPYNPATKYGGPEKIALKNAYVRQHVRDQFSGFVADEKIGEAESYFCDWYGAEMLTWLEQFRRKTNDELELLATVDMAMEELRRSGAPIALDEVKRIIQSNSEWQAKLERAIFSDANIEHAITKCHNLFGA